MDHFARVYSMTLEEYGPWVQRHNGSIAYLICRLERIRFSITETRDGWIGVAVYMDHYAPDTDATSFSHTSWEPARACLWRLMHQYASDPLV